MPFLRVIRDKRGYETTYLMHWLRDGNRQRSRILYVFRTPGGVRVGRESLEPDVLREIETRHPGISFDWKTLFANQQLVESSADTRRPRKRKRAEDEPSPPSIAAAAPEGQPEPQAAPAPPRPSIPASLQGATPDEQIAFLNHWYPVVRERIPQRTSDPARLEALTALAERLNPAAWTDADQIAEGLLRAAEALERLSRVFSRRRRRRRTSKAPAEPQSSELSSSSDS
ncbi:MAG TPA: hypothetical protein VHJ58_18535 [Vicinamibacterales bacterium]|nr:hypothetical protein [Vicinamibacterales bacterium]